MYGLTSEQEAVVLHHVGNMLVCWLLPVQARQQQLIELLTGNRADVMVVGDDDQTIYEWRGARPGYILRDFAKVFSNKPHIDYKLSHSFRFGPLIAQCAQNVISLNIERWQKPLIAHQTQKPAHIEIVFDIHDLGYQLEKLIEECRNPREIIVLARMYSQLSELEAECLRREIPYRVVERGPFFERREITVLLDYRTWALARESHAVLTVVEFIPGGD